MKFTVLTLFPESVTSYFDSSMLKRAKEAGHISIDVRNTRDFSTDTHKAVDDAPYGGGPGMVMMVEPIIAAWRSVGGDAPGTHTIIFSPGGAPLTNERARKWVHEYKHLILIAGRYEGVDARVAEITGAELVSIGDYVLTGGEVPAMALVDVVSRQVAGVLGNKESLEEERSASTNVYTRPAVFNYEGVDYPVPGVLLSGDHKKIDAWRREN